MVKTIAEGVPKAGVTRVGEVANTLAPVPVSSVSAVASWAEVNEPSEAALPTEVTAPVKLAFVVTVVAVVAVVAVAAFPPILSPAAVPVMFVPTSAEGVPRAGVTSVGDVLRTLFPDPVLVVTPVPPEATGSAVVSARAFADSVVPLNVRLADPTTSPLLLYITWVVVLEPTPPLVPSTCTTVLESL